MAKYRAHGTEGVQRSCLALNCPTEAGERDYVYLPPSYNEQTSLVSQWEAREAADYEKRAKEALEKAAAAPPRMLPGGMTCRPPAMTVVDVEPPSLKEQLERQRVMMEEAKKASDIRTQGQKDHIKLMGATSGDPFMDALLRDARRLTGQLPPEDDSQEGSLNGDDTAEREDTDMASFPKITLQDSTKPNANAKTLADSAVVRAGGAFAKSGPRQSALSTSGGSVGSAGIPTVPSPQNASGGRSRSSNPLENDGVGAGQAGAGQHRGFSITSAVSVVSTFAASGVTSSEDRRHSTSSPNTASSPNSIAMEFGDHSVGLHGGLGVGPGIGGGQQQQPPPGGPSATRRLSSDETGAAQKLSVTPSVTFHEGTRTASIPEQSVIVPSLVASGVHDGAGNATAHHSSAKPPTPVRSTSRGPTDPRLGTDARTGTGALDVGAGAGVAGGGGAGGHQNASNWSTPSMSPLQVAGFGPISDLPVVTLEPGSPPGSDQARHPNALTAPIVSRVAGISTTAGPPSIPKSDPLGRQSPGGAGVPPSTGSKPPSAKVSAVCLVGSLQDPAAQSGCSDTPSYVGASTTMSPPGTAYGYSITSAPTMGVDALLSTGTAPPDPKELRMSSEQTTPTVEAPASAKRRGPVVRPFIVPDSMTCPYPADSWITQSLLRDQAAKMRSDPKLRLKYIAQRQQQLDVVAEQTRRDREYALGRGLGGARCEVGGAGSRPSRLEGINQRPGSRFPTAAGFVRDASFSHTPKGSFTLPELQVNSGRGGNNNGTMVPIPGRGLSGSGNSMDESPRGIGFGGIVSEQPRTAGGGGGGGGGGNRENPLDSGESSFAHRPFSFGAETYQSEPGSQQWSPFASGRGPAPPPLVQLSGPSAGQFSGGNTNVNAPALRPIRHERPPSEEHPGQGSTGLSSVGASYFGQKVRPPSPRGALSPFGSAFSMPSATSGPSVASPIQGFVTPVATPVGRASALRLAPIGSLGATPLQSIGRGSLNASPQRGRGRQQEGSRGADRHDHGKDRGATSTGGIVDTSASRDSSKERGGGYHGSPARGRGASPQPRQESSSTLTSTPGPDSLGATATGLGGSGPIAGSGSGKGGRVSVVRGRLRSGEKRYMNMSLETRQRLVAQTAAAQRAVLAHELAAQRRAIQSQSANAAQTPPHAMNIVPHPTIGLRSSGQVGGAGHHAQSSVSGSPLIQERQTSDTPLLPVHGPSVASFMSTQTGVSSQSPVPGTRHSSGSEEAGALPGAALSGSRSGDGREHRRTPQRGGSNRDRDRSSSVERRVSFASKQRTTSLLKTSTAGGGSSGHGQERDMSGSHLTAPDGSMRRSSPRERSPRRVLLSDATNDDFDGSVRSHSTVDEDGEHALEFQHLTDSPSELPFNPSASRLSVHHHRSASGGSHHGAGAGPSTGGYYHHHRSSSGGGSGIESQGLDPNGFGNGNGNGGARMLSVKSDTLSPSLLKEHLEADRERSGRASGSGAPRGSLRSPPGSPPSRAFAAFDLEQHSPHSSYRQNSSTQYPGGAGTGGAGAAQYHRGPSPMRMSVSGSYRVGDSASGASGGAGGGRRDTMMSGDGTVPPQSRRESARRRSMIDENVGMPPLAVAPFFGSRSSVPESPFPKLHRTEGMLRELNRSHEEMEREIDRMDLD